MAVGWDKEVLCAGAAGVFGMQSRWCTIPKFPLPTPSLLPVVPGGGMGVFPLGHGDKAHSPSAWKGGHRAGLDALKLIRET